MGTRDNGILFSKGQLGLNAYCDADWAGDSLDWRSTTGYVIFLGNSPTSWSAKKQNTVSRSSTEAEYQSLAQTAAELYWIRQLLCDLNIFLLNPPVLWCDNASALALAKNPMFHARSKHIEIDYHFVREKVIRGDLQVQYISSSSQHADLFTKSLSTAVFLQFSSKLLKKSSSVWGGILSILLLIKLQLVILLYLVVNGSLEVV